MQMYAYKQCYYTSWCVHYSVPKGLSYLCRVRARSLGLSLVVSIFFVFYFLLFNFFFFFLLSSCHLYCTSYKNTFLF
ncbi:hypothetical protein BDV24DRAFT_135303, partial [Aspergillus arachidicola]